MAGARNPWLTGLFAAMTIGAATTRVAGETPEEVLKRDGLKQVGPLYVLEGEQDAKKKLAEVRQLSRQMNSARLQQAAFGTTQDHQALIQNLNSQVGQMKAELNAVNQQISRLPRTRNRLTNNYVQQEHAELNAYRNQLNVELNQQNSWLKQVKSHPPDPKMKQTLDADVHARSEEYHQAVQDLARLVGTIKDRYARLAKDDEVKKALGGLSLKIRPQPKLGPSHEFHETIKVVERLEKESAEPQSPTEPARKTARKSRRAAAQPTP